MFAPKSHAIVLIAPLMMIASMLDSFLKELPWVPVSLKPLAFFVLVPIIIGGTVAIIPYMKERLSIVTPKKVSNSILAFALAITGLQIVLWAAVYYTVETQSTASIATVSLVFKDVVLVSSALVFAQLATRLLRWYRRTTNRVVLLQTLSIFVVILFNLLHILPDFLSPPTPRMITDAFALSLIALFALGFSQVAMMEREYRGIRGWLSRPVFGYYFMPWLAGLTFAVSKISWFDVRWSVLPLTVLIFGFVLTNYGYFGTYEDLARAVPNKTASEYYGSMGYSFGLWAFATCGLGLRLPVAYPLSGFASLSMMVPAACLSFATFTSSAAYFSISEEVRKQVRRAAGFAASMGEAQSVILTEQQIGQFYDRFREMARASGAVDESAITKDEIQKYVAAIKRMKTRNLPSR